MANTATALLQDNSILEILKILNDANRQAQANEYAEYFGSIDAIQTQLNETLAELKNVRKQLDVIQDRRNPIKKAFTAVLDKLQSEIQAIQGQLNTLKEKLITAARNAVQAVKENGLSALNDTLKFFEVRKDLQATINSSAAVIESCNKSITKIESISNEYHATGLHMRNMGRAVFGKDAIQNQKQKGKLAKALQSLVKFRRNFSSGLKRKCENALAKMENLDQTVQINRSRRLERKAPKSSLMKQIENHQKTSVPMQQSPVQSKKREEVL